MTVDAPETLPEDVADWLRSSDPEELTAVVTYASELLTDADAATGAGANPIRPRDDDEELVSVDHRDGYYAVQTRHETENGSYTELYHVTLVRSPHGDVEQRWQFVGDVEETE